MEGVKSMRSVVGGYVSHPAIVDLDLLFTDGVIVRIGPRFLLGAIGAYDVLFHVTPDAHDPATLRLFFHVGYLCHAAKHATASSTPTHRARSKQRVKAAVFIP